MINKYWLYKKVLENSTLTDELKETPSNFFNLSKEDMYHQRVEDIDNYCLSVVSKIHTLTGIEASLLMQQKDQIMKSLNEQWNIIEGALKYSRTFKEVLEEQFRVTLEHIYNYEKAEKLLTGEREVIAHLDGNKPLNGGHPVLVKTKVYNSTISIEKFRELAERVRVYHPTVLDVDLSVYTHTEGNEFGDYPEECLLNRKESYNISKDKLLIWENNNPVFENDHGVITNDPVALADCYL